MTQPTISGTQTPVSNNIDAELIVFSLKFFLKEAEHKFSTPISATS